MTVSASHRPRRRARSVALASLVLTGTSLFGATASVAAPVPGGGDVRIHPAGLPATSTADAPQVCTFTLAATDVTVPSIAWTITPLPASATAPSLTGTMLLTGGVGKTQDLSLPDGQYRLTWTPLGSTPQVKDFRVDCSSNLPPQGAVHAGGGGVPTGTGADADSPLGTAPLVISGSLAAAAIIFVGRARRNARGAA